MRNIAGVLLATLTLIFLTAQRAELAGPEPLLKLSVLGGAEREENAPAGGRATIELLGVLPLTKIIGLQGVVHYVGGRGSRYGLSLGPIFSWDKGKAGTFVNYQHRTLRDNNFVHVRPSLAFYLDQANLSLWYSHPVSSPQRSRKSIEYGINQIQGTVNYFPPMDLASFMRKDNLELTLGLQVNTFAGAGRSELEGAGVGPVWALAFMPIQGVVVNLFRATIDNRSRYRVASGIQLFFNKGEPTLKELRRKSLAPNLDAPGGGGSIRRPGGMTQIDPPS